MHQYIIYAIYITINYIYYLPIISLQIFKSCKDFLPFCPFQLYRDDSSYENIIFNILVVTFATDLPSEAKTNEVT